MKAWKRIRNFVNVPAEYKLFLIDYKYKHGLFKEKDWRL